MPRMARVVIPNCPHHITQRGNRNQRVFFGDTDKALYLQILEVLTKRARLAVLAYCLMDNHVHLIVTPQKAETFSRAIAETHRKFTTIINTRNGWRGYLWQGRFSSFPMDEPYLYRALRYVERNPVRAGLVSKAEEYPWSSARAHIDHTQDPLLSDAIPKNLITDWRAYLEEPDDDEFLEKVRSHIETGRPLGDDPFLEKLEMLTGRKFLKKKKPL
ncbi:MAG: transposase [Candidatus Aminicenantes bacterium]|nr:transposase [Candidatus Aminicenantes bacterium]